MFVPNRRRPQPPMVLAVPIATDDLAVAFSREAIIPQKSTEERFCLARQALHDLIVQSFWDHDDEESILARLAYKSDKLAKLAAMLAGEKYPNVA